MLETGIYKRNKKSFISWERYIPDTNKKAIGIIYLHGLLSSKKSRKGTFVKEFAIAHNLSYLGFDFTAHGESSGKAQDVKIGQCLQDAIDILDVFTTGPQIVIGSSMGSWVGLLLAQKRPERITGFIGIAPGVDFTKGLWEDILSEENRIFIQKGGILGPDKKTRGYCFTLDFFENAKQHFLLNGPIVYESPVILIRGDKDALVSAKTVLKIKENLTSPNVTILEIKGAEHSLSRPSDLNIIANSIQLLVKQAQS